MVKGKKKSEELCDCENERKKDLEKLKVMNEEETENFLRGADIKKEFNF